jgi:single-strand DNA-binding protein
MSYFSINRVVLVGRLTRDPELRALPSGVSVCGVRIACNSSRRDGDGGYTEKPNFFDVSIYGASADSAGRYIRKGSRVAVDGRLEWREWETTDQKKRQAVSIVADTIQFLDSPGDRSEIGGQADGGSGGDLADEEEPEGGELAGVGTGAKEDLAF